MLGNAETSKIRADVDAERTGGMFFRIRQHGEVHTVDALVAQFTALFAQGRLDIISTNTLYLTLKNVVHKPSSETHDSSVILFFV